jgi:hypothetical protein
VKRAVRASNRFGNALDDQEEVLRVVVVAAHGQLDGDPGDGVHLVSV